MSENDFMENNSEGVKIFLGVLFFVLIGVFIFLIVRNKCKATDDECEKDEDCCENLKCMLGTCSSPILCALHEPPNGNPFIGKYDCPSGKKLINTSLSTHFKNEDTFEDSCCRDLKCSDFNIMDCPGDTILDITGEGKTLDECCVPPDDDSFRRQTRDEDEDIEFVTTGSSIPCSTPLLDQEKYLGFMESFLGMSVSQDDISTVLAAFDPWPGLTVAASFCETSKGVTEGQVLGNTLRTEIGADGETIVKYDNLDENTAMEYLNLDSTYEKGLYDYLNHEDAPYVYRDERVLSELQEWENNCCV